MVRDIAMTPMHEKHLQHSRLNSTTFCALGVPAGEEQTPSSPVGRECLSNDRTGKRSC